MFRRTHRICPTLRSRFPKSYLILIACLLVVVYIWNNHAPSQPSESIHLYTAKVRQKTSAFQTPKEAFVTFVNDEPKYLNLLQVLLDSIHTFSTRPIIVYQIGTDINIDFHRYPRVIERRIFQEDCGPSIYFCKLYAIIHSNVQYGVLLETDDIVNYNIDILFDVLHRWPYSLPLLPRHPDQANNYHFYMKRFNVSKPTTPYMHGHVTWTYRALPFLRQVHALLKKGNFRGANYDETALNVMLWKEKANHTLCKYDPYYASLGAYERWPLITNCSKDCHTVYLTLHGSKNTTQSATVLAKLKANVGKPAVQTFGMGGMKHIHDSNATCCFPDSQPSSIHPLLCEHSTSPK